MCIPCTRDGPVTTASAAHEPAGIEAPGANRFAFVLHPLTVDYLGNHPRYRWTRHLPRQWVEAAAAYMPGRYVGTVDGRSSDATGKPVDGLIYALGATPRQMLTRPPEFTYTPAEPGDEGCGRPRGEDRRARRVHQGRRRRGHHRRETRADPGDDGQQPHHRRDARDGEAHARNAWVGTTWRRQGDDRRGDGCDRLGVLAPARGGGQGRGAGVHRAGPPVGAQAEDPCRNAGRDRRDRPDDRTAGSASAT